MREGGKMLATVLHVLKSSVEVGMSTKDLSKIAVQELNKLGGTPTILGYQGFPEAICISINEEVVHGIPSDTKIIQDGDLVSLDFCVTHKNLITDAAVTIIAGKPLSQKDVDLLKFTEKSLNIGINAAHNGVHTGDIGSQIEAELTRHNFGVVRDLVGHGVGDDMHEDPNVPNYGKKGSGPTLSAGMTIAIEPMATLGTERVYVGSDSWTVLTWDGSRSAHFEHTIAITDDGAEILTKL